MADATYQPKVYRKGGGDTLVVASGGSIEIESGGTLNIDGSAIKIKSGVGTLDGTNPTAVVTGLSSVVSIVAGLNGTAAPADATHVFSAVVGTGGTAHVYGWMPTSGTDPTLVASTNTEAFAWIAVGT
ncbi:MAG: hypothetical protein AB7E70_21020 [Hyphomicrobiaceae bacterium]